VPDDAILRVLRVPPEKAGSRLDVFVQGELRNTSRTRAHAIVERSAFAPDGRRLRANDRVRAEDRVVLWRPPLAERDEPMPLPVLHQDQHLLVVDKPAPLAVHPTARHHRHTVIKLLAAARPGEWLSLVHRLDRETSGILLVARSPAADRAFKKLIEDRSIAEARSTAARSAASDAADAVAHRVEKTYLAITWGVPPAGLIELPLEIDPTNPLRVKMRVAARGGGLESRTRVEVLEARGGYALCRCELSTGRQHQIRVHLAAAGCPVVGDKLYGPNERLLARAADGVLDGRDLAQLELPRHALHAHRCRLRHAVTGEPLDLVSPLPPDLAEFWERLRS
jgi:23S rRNA pseudouridine1911/1915/1917 synthase